MDLDRRASDIIDQAEKALAALAGEAAGQRDYGRAAMLLSLAQRVAGTRQSEGPAVAPSPIAAGQSDSPSSSNGKGKQVLARTTKAPAPVASFASHQAGPAVAVSRGADAGKYPRFKREGETLVKIGWSKSDRSTYEHRSPKEVALKLVGKVKQFGTEGHRFTTEDLMPLRDDHGGELPSYQGYLCLAWLVLTGILERHGRQGYTVRVAGDLDQAVEAAWQELPRR